MGDNGDNDAATAAELSVDHISEQRLRPYAAATSGDTAKAVQLYAWGRKLSAAFFHDIAVLEVALRNSIDRALSATYTDEWFRLSAALFDARTYGQLAAAWDGLPGRFLTAHHSSGTIKGRLIAGCMFGTWVSMLDAGGSTGLDGPCARADHDLVWTRDLLLTAFPGAGPLARKERAELNRAWVHRQVREVHTLRNRVAHHESLINGYPIPGTGGGSVPPERRTASEGTAACLKLAGMIDRNLADFLQRSSTVARTLDGDPRIGWGFR